MITALIRLEPRHAEPRTIPLRPPGVAYLTRIVRALAVSDIEEEIDLGVYLSQIATR